MSVVIVNKGNGQVIPARKLGVPRGEQPTNRTSAGLRNALFDEIDALRRGDGDPQRATAVAQLAKTILLTAKLEFQFKKAGFPSTEQIPAFTLGDNEDQGNG
jgi:hypothetical protein